MAIGRLTRGVILALTLGCAQAAEPPTTVLIGTPPQPVWQQLDSKQKAILEAMLGDLKDLREMIRSEEQ